MNENLVVYSEKPRSYGWAMSLLATLFCGAFVFAEVRRFLLDGWVGWETFWVWLAETSLMAIVLSPLFLHVRSVKATRDGLQVKRILGRPRPIRWAQIKSVGVFGTRGRYDRATSVIRIVPMNGRSFTFSSAMTNYKDLLSAVERHAANVRREPSFVEALMLKAR